MSAIHEDDTFIKEKLVIKQVSIAPDAASKRRASRDDKPKRYSLQKTLIPTLIPVFEASSFRRKLTNLLHNRITEIFLMGLILIYTLLVLVNIVLDDGTDTNQTITDTLRVLKFLELAILVIFMIEIIFRVCAFGVKVSKTVN